MAAIDLNADLGAPEPPELEAELLDLVTSVNVGVGFPAEAVTALRRASEMAVERHVSIGALVSPAGGRPVADAKPEEVRDAVLHQLGALDAFAQVVGAGVLHVRPDAILVDAAARDPELAVAVVSAAHEFDPSLAVVAPVGSDLLRLADGLGMEAVPQALVDRHHDPDGLPLVADGAEPSSPAEVADRAVLVAVQRRVVAIDGSSHELRARSLHVDGTVGEKIDRARAIRRALGAAQVGVHAFAI